MSDKIKLVLENEEDIEVWDNASKTAERVKKWPIWKRGKIFKDSTIAFTGHRPDKLGGYKIPNKVYDYVVSELNTILDELKPEIAISGMAIGFDQYAAQVCIDKGIPFIAAIPFKGQESRWPEASKQKYREILEQALEVVVVSPGIYSPEKMQIRNEWMIDNCGKVAACFDGSKGGTKNCVVYAQKQNKSIYTIDPRKAI